MNDIDSLLQKLYNSQAKQVAWTRICSAMWFADAAVAILAIGAILSPIQSEVLQRVMIFLGFISVFFHFYCFEKVRRYRQQSDFYEMALSLMSGGTRRWY